MFNSVKHAIFFLKQKDLFRESKMLRSELIIYLKREINTVSEQEAIRYLRRNKVTCTLDGILIYHP